MEQFLLTLWNASYQILANFEGLLKTLTISFTIDLSPVMPPITISVFSMFTLGFVMFLIFVSIFQMAKRTVPFL